KATEKAVLDEASAQAERLVEDEPDMPLLLLGGAGWHKGVVGLVASRLTERHRLPSIVIGWDDDGLGVGSARSIPGVDVGTAISRALESGLLVKGGGHAMAAGLTVTRDAVSELTAFLGRQLRDDVRRAAERNTLSIDAAVMASGITPMLMEQIEKAGPFGNSNPQPRIALAAHRCSFAKLAGTDHVRCTLSGTDGGRVDAVAFRSAETELGRALLDRAGKPLHIAGHLRRDNWQGRERLQLVIEDAAIPARG
ncbi:MAG: DHHA1 domain-containing protein, partial [Hyphomicrobiales bacterium]